MTDDKRAMLSEINTWRERFDAAHQRATALEAERDALRREVERLNAALAEPQIKKLDDGDVQAICEWLNDERDSINLSYAEKDGVVRDAEALHELDQVRAIEDIINTRWPTERAAREKAERELDRARDEIRDWIEDRRRLSAYAAQQRDNLRRARDDALARAEKAEALLDDAQSTLAYVGGRLGGVDCADDGGVPTRDEIEAAIVVYTDGLVSAAEARAAEAERERDEARNEAICHCGISIYDHSISDNHAPIPMPRPCPAEARAAKAEAQRDELVQTIRKGPLVTNAFGFDSHRSMIGRAWLDKLLEGSDQC